MVGARREGAHVKVFLVDDHEVVRRGVAELLEENAFEIVGQAASVAQAMARIPAARPDVVVLDVRLPDGNGVELCRDLLAEHPFLNCLMLTSFPDEQAMADAVLAGARGYVLKDVAGIDLVASVRDAGLGRSMFSGRAMAAVTERLRAKADSANDPVSRLTPQERTVLELIGEGLTNRQIGQRMFLAEKTVKNYVSRLLMKLGMQRRTQAAVLASDLRHQHTHP